MTQKRIPYIKVARAAEQWVIASPTMLSIRNGLLLTLPLVTAGSMALLVNNFPLWTYQKTMLNLFGECWKAWGNTVWNSTFGILALLMLYSISHQLTVSYNQQNPIRPVSPVIVTLVSLASLISIIPGTADSLLPELWTGSSGLFVSILVALLSTKIFLFFFRLRFLRPPFNAEGIDVSIPQAFSCLLPGILTIALFGFIKILFILLIGNSIHEIVYNLVLSPFLALQNTPGTSAAYVSLSQLLWFFGIHGANVLDPVSNQFYEIAMQQNLAAIAAGQTPPHIVTKLFLDVFVYMGGTGSSICLIIAVLLVSKNNGSRKLAQFSLFPGMFNINEPVLFGMPIILNPTFLIPFILTPLILTFSSYAAIALSWVPPPIHPVAWTTPPLLSGYASTGSSSAVLLQCFNILLGTLIYMPFVAYSDKIKAARRETAMKNLMTVASSNTVGPSGKKCLDRNDEVGALARTLVNELEYALQTSQGLFLEYQPQINYKTGKVIGAEALIRWESKCYGQISPPITIAIAEDSDLIHNLGLWIINEACAERIRWKRAGLNDELKLSINLSVLQLKDIKLPAKIVEIIEKQSITPSMIGLEITESVALDPDSEHGKLLHQIHAKGISIAIDDFGMGHSSLLYLKQFPVSTLKIDKGLSKEVVHDKTCQDIIIAIIDLCTALKVNVIVEYVENKAQIELLVSMGCHLFQGYYFSRPLCSNDFIAYTNLINVLES